ncbi:protein white-like [Limulus polyphemus]|uniref:Protein white-like n=1 Tax=Limulus polyphemus TaxID=6850 RepID=A0ABM1SVU6_LIMPO|nr:protein white-like [Limulus polyphemus]
MDTGTTVSWRNICVSVSEKKNVWPICFGKKTSSATQQKRLILKNVSGEAKPGQLLAVMGASGCGKTTLLNVVAGKSCGKMVVQGSVLINGMKQSMYARSTLAYVEQTYLFVDTLTVQEHLRFQVALKLHYDLCEKEQEMKVHELLTKVQLVKQVHTRIKLLSGGEKKRLAFATEMLMDPSLLLCDEPTSGLDSFMAQNVISVLQGMAAAGRTIICTIHQPSSEVYAMFSDILLLADGRVAYMGHTNQVMDFFNSLDMFCPANYNPADYFIKVLGIPPEQDIEQRESIKRICDAWENTITSKTLQQGNSRTDRTQIVNNHFSNAFRPAPFFTQLKILGIRSFLETYREDVLIPTMLLTVMIQSILLSYIYWKQKAVQESIQNINGVHFIIINTLVFFTVFGSASTTCIRLKLFFRDNSAGLYRTDVFFLSFTTSQFPAYVLFAITCDVLVSTSAGLYHNISSCFVSILIKIFLCNAVVSTGYVIACVTNNSLIASVVLPLLITPLQLFSGFYLNIESMPIVLRWIKYISWFYYAYEASLINYWQYVDNIVCPEEQSICYRNGDDVLHTFNFKKDHLEMDILGLGVLVFAIRFLAFAILYLRTKVK